MSYGQELIKQLNLKAHPEGGYYKRTYQSPSNCINDGNERFCSTLIHYLLLKNDVSKFHRLKSDEIWIHQLGEGIKLHLLNPDGTYGVQILGADINIGQQLQVVISGGIWFAAELLDKTEFGLASCMVSPGFDFDDFEMASQTKLKESYPNHIDLIKRFT